MSDSLKAGSVYVAVTASIGEFTKSMAQVVKQAEETAKKIKESAAFVAGVGALFAAGIVQAVEQATEANAALNEDVERLKSLLYTLAGDLGDLFAPAVRQVTDALDLVVAFLQTLDPGTKKAVANFALFAAGTGVVSAGVAGAAGLVEGLAKTLSVTLVPAVGAVQSSLPLLGRAFKVADEMARAALSATVSSAKGLMAALTGLPGMARAAFASTVSGARSLRAAFADIPGTARAAFAAAVSGARSLKAALMDLPGLISSLSRGFLSLMTRALAVTGPVALLALAVGAIVLGAGAVYEAWNDTSTGLKEAVLEAVESLRGYAQRLGAFFKSIFTGLRDLFLGLAVAALETVLAQVRLAAAAFEKLARTAQATTLADELAKLQGLTGASVVSKLAGTMEAAGEAAGKWLAKGVDAVADVGSAAAGKVAQGVQYGAKGLKHAFDDAAKATGLSSLLSQMEGLVGQIFGGDAATQRARAEKEKDASKPEVEVSKIGQARYESSLAALGRGESSPILKALRDKAEAEAKARTEAMEKVREAMLAAREAMKAAKEAAKEAFSGKLTSRTGNVQGLVESGAQGAAMGGPAVAVGAVVLDLITQSQGFAEIIGMVNTVIQQVADALGSFLVPLQPLIAAVLRLVPIIANALGPVFSFVGQLLEPLVPVFYIIGEVLQVLEPILTMFAGALELLTLPLTLIVDTGLRLLFEGIKYLGVGVLGVARGISWLWNGVVEGVQWVLRGLANLPFLGALNDVADALEDVKVDREALKQSQEELLNLSYEQARAKAAETAATMKNTAALKEATESLTNVPAAWRVVQRRFEAQDARTGSPLLLPVAGASSAPTSPATSSEPSSAQAAPAQAAAPAIAINTLNVSGEDTGRALSKLEQHLDNLSFRNRGTRAQPGRYAVEGG
jgi:hypothetical protein